MMSRDRPCPSAMPGRRRESERVDSWRVVRSGSEEVMVVAGDKPVRFVLASGKPLKEPIAWQGPIVMNTREEIAAAFDQLRKGTFINK